MSGTQADPQTKPSRRYQAGVAKKLDRILIEVDDLRAPMECVIAELRRDQQSEQSR